MKLSHLKRKSTKPTKTLRRKAWKAFSSWVKKRDGYRCVTCGKQMSYGDPNCHAGHFIHGDSVDFLEENINCQCSRCNKFLHGNGVEYAIFMVKKYSLDMVNRLRCLKHEPRKFTREELEQIIEQYKGE